MNTIDVNKLYPRRKHRRIHAPAMAHIERVLGRILQRRLKAMGIPIHYVFARLIVQLVLDMLAEQIPGVMERLLGERRLRQPTGVAEQKYIDKANRGIRLLKFLRREKPQSRRDDRRSDSGSVNRTI